MEQARNQGGAGGAKTPRKFFAPPGKICWTYIKTIGHNLKIWALSENSSPLLVSQAAYGPAREAEVCYCIVKNIV